jgi:hypothetical protein
VEYIPPLRGRWGYSEYVLRHLRAHVHTEHALIFQWDGFVSDPAAWRPEFLQYDYVGALFPPVAGIPTDKRVGNGGFCLRSARLLDRVAALAPAGSGIAEDVLICCELGEHLRNGHGIEFAPPALAKHFSVDMMSLPIYRDAEPGLVEERTFGIHGFCNFHKVFTDDELLEIVDTRMPSLREELLTSRPAAALMVNLCATGRTPAAVQLGLRAASMLGLPMPGTSLRDVVARCEERHVA